MQAARRRLKIDLLRINPSSWQLLWRRGREGSSGGIDSHLHAALLGSWRSTLIVAISIPLSVLASLSLLSALGHTLM